MTPKLSDLSDDQIRVMVAEECGWRLCDPVKFDTDALWHLKGKGFAMTHQIPDYLKSLDACAEFEQTFEYSQDAWLCYESAILSVSKYRPGMFRCKTLLGAKPRTKAIAFLLAKGRVTA
jgi:hypothetical protein